jgi:hypothetical protein
MPDALRPRMTRSPAPVMASAALAAASMAVRAEPSTADVAAAPLDDRVRCRRQVRDGSGLNHPSRHR